MSPAASTLAPMTERLVRPDWVRRVNLMADAVGGRARDLVPIDAADLLDRASAALGGLPDGDLGDPLWQQRFEALVAAIDAAPMHVVGRLMTKQELLRSLRTRLLVTAAIDAAPEIVERPVAAPVFITGPARSGTSILFELLALDPRLRAPTAAEALHPVALPESRSSATVRRSAVDGHQVGGRPGTEAVTLPEAQPPEDLSLGAAALPEALVLGECEQEFWADVQPEFQALHELRSDLPVECVTVTQGSFCGFHWSMIAALGDWMPDPAVNYAYERQFLQVLQHVASPGAVGDADPAAVAGVVGVAGPGAVGGADPAAIAGAVRAAGPGAAGPGAVGDADPAAVAGVVGGADPANWVLKTPGHLMLLPLLFAEFDDAWVVQTHRDPAKTMPSTVSTTAMVQWMRTDHVDVDGMAETILAFFTAGLNGTVQLRETGVVPAERFVDVHFAELMSDPVATLRAAYDRMGREFADAHADAVLDYLAHKPKGKFGVHRYRPEDWGFTAAGLRSALAPYIDHFGVASEG